MRARRTQGGTDGRCRTRRALLMRWIDKGGPVPERLLEHAATCPKCRARIQRISRVSAGFTLLATQAAPIGLIGRANERALGMLARTLRATPKADQLRKAKPSVGIWPKIEGPLARTAGAAAAAMILLSLRTGINGSIERTTDLIQPLADLHYERHIDDGKI